MVKKQHKWYPIYGTEAIGAMTEEAAKVKFNVHLNLWISVMSLICFMVSNYYYNMHGNILFLTITLIFLTCCTKLDIAKHLKIRFIKLEK